MRKLLEPFSILLLLFSLCSAVASEEAADTPVSDPLVQYSQALDKQIELTESQESTSENEKLLERLLQAQDQLEKAKSYQKQVEESRQLLDNFGEETQSLKAQLKDFNASTFPDFSQWGQDQLTLEIADQDNKLEQLELRRHNFRNELEDIERDIDAFPKRAEQLHQQIGDAEKAQKQAERDRDTQLLLVHNIEFAFYNNQLSALETELLAADNRRTLTKQKLQLVNAEIEARQAYRNNLQLMLNRLLRTEAEQTAQDTDALVQELEDLPPELKQLSEENRRYANVLSSLSDQLDQVQEQQETTDHQLEQVAKTSEDLSNMAEWLSLSPAFSENMRTRLSRLPSPPNMGGLDNQIAQNQVRKYEYQQRYEDLSDIADSPPTKNLSDEQKTQQGELIENNLSLLEKLIDSSDILIYQQATLKVAFDKLNTSLEQLKNNAARLLFWAPDTNAFSLKLVENTLEKLQWFFSPSHWVGLLKVPFVADPILLGFCLIIISLLILALSWCRKRWKKYLSETSQSIGKVTRDRFSFSTINVVISGLFAWPVPLTVAVVGALLTALWQLPFIHHLGQALALPWPLVMFCFMRELVRPDGLLIKHFDWQPSLVARCFGHYRRLIWLYLPMMVIQNFAIDYNDSEVNATLGRLAFLISNLAVSFFLWRMANERIPMTYRDLPQGQLHIGHHLFWWLLILLPQVLNYFALQGYLGSAQKLMSKLEYAAVLGVFTLLIYYLIKRLMLIQRRRLAFERAKAKRQEILAQRKAELLEEKEEPASHELHIDIEEPEVDLDIISAQSLRLLRSLLLLIFLSLLALLSSDLYQATSFLEDITLWDVNANIDGIEQLSHITLKSVLLALLALWLTAILARDLPGAMELLVLQHISLSPGTGYAITSLTRYLAIFFGIIIGSALIGFDWSKMQWLIAALGVGLGFGLQEIFANFISGLIILFEKPIRIGDTVTIRDLTGVVAKINTRATTIVDWDRKEVIVPNKAFVTEQFVNWSLSDSITRVTISISVKYLADTDLVTQLLFDAAEECELVLDNPAPEVFFLSITADAQNFEVRAYAAETGHRLSLTHDLHSRIKRKFLRHDISIAHPQLEVAIKKQQRHPLSR
ncbi:miniconductance mechanosensitive channel MscM [Photobacterium sp. GJ3]|uniref:miniconductance mechanosensitive channel MscM n=1 Tax=Photobacterium sp. GJ3 TaxID=2829502 RepID=UPI001B8B7DD7|nr:miniconductance mechanosensitive channel MscM [Photobacterium sp. GJ3]QUJ68446.1 miniconductance mechanosensitive channel MscM [Photobacterium sp. GJ3]